MKNYFVLFFILSFTYSCQSQNNQSDLQNLNLNGQVAEIHSFKYDIGMAYGEIILEDKLTNKASMKFSEKGMLVEESNDFIRNPTKGRSVYHYDKDGNLVKLLKISRYESGTLDTARHYIYHYNEDNLKIKEQLFRRSELSSTYLFEYNEKNIISKQYMITKKKDTLLTIIYNDNGLKEKSVAWTPTSTWEYDEKGNMVKEILDYPTAGRKITTYEYDDFNNLINLKDLGAGAIGRSMGFDNKIYKYEYDDNNNWITKTTYYNTTPMYFEKRDITYF